MGNFLDGQIRLENRNNSPIWDRPNVPPVEHLFLRELGYCFDTLSAMRSRLRIADITNVEIRLIVGFEIKGNDQPVDHLGKWGGKTPPHKIQMRRRLRIFERLEI